MYTTHLNVTLTHLNASHTLTASTLSTYTPGHSLNYLLRLNPNFTIHITLLESRDLDIVFPPWSNTGYPSETKGEECHGEYDLPVDSLSSTPRSSPPTTSGGRLGARTGSSRRVTVTGEV